MCLPFLCGGDREDNGRPPDHQHPPRLPPQQPPPALSDQEHGQPHYDKPATPSPVKETNQYGNAVVPPAAAGGEGKNGVTDHKAQEGVNGNGGRATAAYSSDPDVSARVGVVRGRKGDVEKIAAPTTVAAQPPAEKIITSSPPPAPQAPERRAKKITAPTTAWQAPERREQKITPAVATAGPRHNGPVAASHPRKGTADTLRTAPVPQMAWRSQEDYSATTITTTTAAAPVVAGHDHDDEHGGEDDRKLRGNSWW